MKKLVIHAGYPKAASTTLQNGLFYTLHNHGRINFLGRAWENGFYGVAKDKESYKRWLIGLMEKRIGSSGKSALGDFRDDCVNLFSEGIFMNNETHGTDFFMPSRIKEYFDGRADRIEILLILRSQRTLIPSYYVQNYRKIRMRFSDYIRKNENSRWSGSVKVFDFYSVASEYARIFGNDNLHLVLFEDLVNDKDRFSAQIGRLVGVEAETISACLEKKHFNKTKRVDRAVFVKKLDTWSIRRLAARMFDVVGIDGGRFFAKKIPMPTKEETDQVFESFKRSNELLADQFSLDKDSMREYGYF